MEETRACTVKTLNCHDPTGCTKKRKKRKKKAYGVDGGRTFEAIIAYHLIHSFSSGTWSEETLVIWHVHMYRFWILSPYVSLDNLSARILHREPRYVGNAD